MLARLRPRELLTAVGGDVDRSLRRARNGLRYLAGTRPPAVGRTPKDVVWQRDKAQLWRYRSNRVRFSPPVVLVHSLVSRSLILDLRPGHSLVEFLRDAGFDVYMVDWGVADELDAENTLETYIDEYLPRAIRAACAESGSDEVTLNGYCLGGVLALLYAAGHADAPVRNLVTMAAPIDLSALGAMVALIREGRLEADDLLDETGNVPPDVLLSGFRMLVPTDQLVQYVNLWERMWSDEFVEAHQAMAAWAHDHVPFPGAAFRQIVDLLVRRNALMSGRVTIGGRVIKLADARCDVLNVMAEQDTVVPIAAAAPLADLLSVARVDELRIPAGHVAFAAGRHARTLTMPRLAGWLASHSEPNGDLLANMS
jgi:poly[(R)-3-hydroxyalkanoate] polymerase subunit PhaC